jgi:gliding motility-associated-like protein
MNINKSILTSAFLSLFLVGNLFAGNFYWVGNSGNWSDASHWATTSGGNGGVGVPTLSDDVHFDQNSFSQSGVISINGNAVCKSFLFSTSHTVELSSSLNQTLSVSGSFTVNALFENNFYGKTIFTSNENQTPLSFDKEVFVGDVEFNGDGSWILKSDLLTSDSNYIYLKHGELIADNVTIYGGGIDATGSKTKTLSLNNATLYSHNKALFNSSTFILINNNSDFIINRSASFINIGEISENTITYGSNTKLTNTCGAIPFTITASVLSNYNGFGVSCQDTCNAVTYVSITGGVGPFTILWGSGTPSPGIGDTSINVCQGNVGVQVTDMGQNPPFGTQCTDQVLVTNPIALAINLIGIISPTCNGDCDGQIGTAIAFGVGPYDVSWLQVPDITPAISNLCAGPYDINVIDANGCTATDSYVLSEPASITFQLDSTNINCFGVCSGAASISLEAGGNAPPYFYSWSTGDTIVTSLSNLCAGPYSATVSDSVGCSTTQTVNITVPTQLSVDTILTHASCGGVCDGAITVTVLGGGSPPFTHFWSTGIPPVNGNSSTIGPLCAGSYTDTIRDANGCDTIITMIITEPVPLITTTNTTDVTCFGDCDGTAITNASGGTIGYSYVWTPDPGIPNGQGTDSIFNLCPGQYIVDITDPNNCTISDTVNITEPLLLVANPSASDVSCNGVCDGSVTGSANGGTTPYSFQWTDPLGNPLPPGPNANSLCPGTYLLTVTDSNNCVDTASVTIAEPQVLTLTMSKTDMSCNGVCDGTAGVVVTGGTGNPANFTYTWVAAPGSFTGGQGTPNITGLCAGTYTVTVVDSANCSNFNSIIVIEPPAVNLNLTTTDLSCNGVCNGTATVTPVGGSAPYTVSWNGAVPGIVIPAGGSNTITGLCASPPGHTVTVTDNNNCPITINFNINEPPPLTTTTVGTNLTCNGVCNGTATTTPVGGSGNYNYVWVAVLPGSFTGGQGTPTITGACAGTYIVTITDDSSCTVIDSVIITEPNLLDPNVSFTNITCNGANDGTAISIPIGGTPPYASINWTDIANNPIFGNGIGPLAAGQYVVTVVDDSGCVAMDTITIIDPAPFTVNATPTNASCGTVCDGVITAVPSGGTGNPANFTYQWDDAPLNQATQTATGLCAGVYTVIVTDSNGCVATDFDTVVNIVTVQITTNAVNNGCNTICDGVAIATGGGGTGPYTYVWSAGNPGAPPGDTTFNLCQGWVFVTVTDSLGCASTDSALVPAAPPVFQLNPSSTNVTCNGDCDGVATIAPTGGVLPYTILWFDNSTGNSVSGLCASAVGGPGPYWVTGTDSVGCVINDTIIIIQPDTIAPNPTVTDVNCNGDSTGGICVAPTGGTPGYQYSWGGGLGTNACISNQPSGNYTVTITDTLGCTRIEPLTINEPTLFSSIPIQTNISCFGANDGMAGVIVSGGTPPDSCIWSNGVTNADTIFNLTPAAYSVTCIDANGCTTTQNFNIIEPTQLNPNVTGTSIACGGTPCTGTAVSNPTGGTLNYTFQWSAVNGSPLNPNATADSLFNLCQDTFNVIVTDGNNCTANGQYIVATPTVLAVTLDSTNITCNGANDGTATATVTGGTPPYTYSWVGGSCPFNPSNTQTITNLCPGIYTVTVTDSFGCSFIGSVNIIDPPAIVANEVVTMANCGANDGVIVTNPSGGTPFYTHSWSNGANTSTITNLSAGSYTDTITDFNGCVSIITINVSNPNGPTGVTTTVNDATCFGVCDGSLNVIPIGGTAPYAYAWAGPGLLYNNDSTETGLCAGTHIVTVTDAAGCILVANVLVGEADSITANSSFTNATCNGVCDGTASVSPSGGTPPYNYLWSTGSTNSSVSGLCIGLTTVTITDFNGCTKVVNFNITSPNSLTIASTTTNVLCKDSCDGTATATPSGGTATYTYQWNDPLSQTSQTATGLCAGTFIVTVTDFNGCSANDTVTITEPTAIVANAITTDATCGNSDGTANVCASAGGTGVHTYLWTTVPGNPTTCSVAGLPAGTYPVEITDLNGCMETFLIAISNIGGPTTTVNSTNASCSGVCDGSATVTVTSGTPNFTYLWSNTATTPTVNGLCAGNYTVQVTDGNGCITVLPVTITDNTVITATVSTIDATCNGVCDGSAIVVPSGGIPPYSYNWSTGHTINAVGGLCAGNHTVTITDAIGCSTTINVIIGEPALLTVNVTGTNASCNNGSDGTATVTPSGGTTAYTYLWSNNATTPTIVGLTAGTYTVTVTDANGCSANGFVVIGEGSTINTTIAVTDATCGVCDGTATAALPTGGAGGPYTYSWSPVPGNTPTLTGLCPGAYALDVTDNAGCTQTFNILINNPNGPVITAASDSVTCFGACDGEAWVTIASGNAPYTYQWDDISLTINDTATALCAGFYNIIVRDNLGCISVDSTTVLEPQEILANITFTEPTCASVCDGTATVTPTGGVGSYTISWNGAAAIPIAIGGSNTITGLCAGVHTALITDQNGCSITDSVTLTDPTPITITISATTPTCAGDCDATALATASGGTPGYTYSWNIPPVQPNSLATGLCAGGPYVVTVTDNNGCTDTASVIVVDPLLLTTNSVVTNASCTGACDGSVTTTPAGGVGPYTFVWNTAPAQTTGTATGLCAGTYIVTVIDANNCSVNDTVTVTQPAIINDSTVVTGPSCGVCDGSATSTPFGGVGPFDFTWTDPLGTNPSLPFTTLNQASSTVVGLCAGTVDLQIFDIGSGCTYNYTIIVNSITGPNLALTSTDETCIGACDGTALASASGGTLPYVFSWNTVPVQSDSNAINLCIGTYTVTVTDSQNCVSVDTVTINTNSLNLSTTSIIPETCFGNCDGSATVSVGSGTGPFTYQWNDLPLPGQTTPTATGLCVGLYTATVTDISCTDSISVNITGPALLTVSASVNIPVSCNGFNDGAAIANALGGTVAYAYQWNTTPTQTTQIATGLTAGTYIVIVTDDNNCTATDSVTITEPTPVLANEDTIPPNCQVCDGAITVNPTGGIGTYTFNWTATNAVLGSVTNTITNLCAGGYSVDITDVGTGCVTTFNFPLSNTNAPLPNTVVTDASCNGVCDGQITSTPTGGTAPYSYSWNPASPIDTNQTITGLCAGPYILNVTDALGCIGVATDNVLEPNPLQANMTFANVTCNGLNDGWAMANPTGGTANFNFAWTPAQTNADSVINLTPGIHAVIITDANNCTVTDSVTITEPSVITSTSVQTDVTCSSVCDGAATVTPAGGTGPYTYLWNSNLAPGQLPTEIGLCFGQNLVVITDDNGCSITDTIMLGAIDTVLANAGNDTTICEGTSLTLIGTPTGTFTGVQWFELVGMVPIGTTDTISVSPTGVGTTCYVYQVTGACISTDTICITTDASPTAGAGPDVTILEHTSTVLLGTGGGTYVWSPGSSLNDSTLANPIASPLVTTTYIVTVTSPGGCVAFDTITVEVVPKINFPDGITPNGDGYNDVWIIDFIEQFPGNVVEIYNRWGELLFHADGYQQDWDGTYEGKELPIGTYYYIIDLNSEFEKPFTGPITILR